MKKFMFLFVFCTLGFSVAWAQKTFSGKVIGSDGLGLPGVSVVEKDNPINGVSTDINGRWTLTVPNGNSIIQFTSIGMKTVEFAAKDAKNIKMREDAQMLDEVVVEVPYGTVRKESLVGAQSSVSSDQIEKRPITNITSALSGTAPGVQVTTSSGQPGSSSSIRIRGFGSINASSAPLYVVDGSVYNGAISDIPSSDIANVSILKDAASAALYGSSAGNGVVLITTKSGKQVKRGKPSFNFVMHQGISKKGQSDYKKIGVMDYYTTRWQQWYNKYKYDDGDSDEVAGAWAAYDVLKDLKYNPYAGIKTQYEYVKGKLQLSKNPDPNNYSFPAIVMPDGTLNPEINGLLYGDDLGWEDALFRTGHRSEYNLNGSYKTDKFKSYMSFGHIDEEGYRIKTGMKRFTGRLNLSYKANKFITIGSNLSYSTAKITQPKTSKGSYSSNSFKFVRGMAPIYPIHKHNPDGSYILDAKGNKVYDHDKGRPYVGGFNPVEESHLDLSTYRRDAFNSRSFVDVKILPGLKFRTNVAYDLYTEVKKIRYNNVMGDQPIGLLKMSNYRGTTLTINELLEYTKNFGDHHLNLLVGHESYKRHTHSADMSKKGIGILGIDEMSNVSEPGNLNSSTGNYRKEGYFSRINYDFAYKYNFSASYRRDGTSRLHPDYRWGNFWSVGVGWHIKKEKFLQRLDWIDALKVRLSIGQTGNDMFDSWYAYQTTYGLGNNNNDRAGIRLNSFALESLTWETQTSSDFALDFGILNRLRGTIELFQKESKNLIFAFPLPTSTGIGSIDKNLGKVRNYGIEASLEFDIIRNNTTNWSFNINGTSFKNEIVELPEENRKDGIEKGTKKYLEGKSRYEYYLREWIGVDPDDGLAIYRLDKEQYPDEKGLEAEGEKSTWTKKGKFAKKHFCGSSIPKIYGGFGTSFKWKNVDFNTLFSYQLGGKTYDSAYQGLMGRSLKGGAAMHKDMLNAWKNPGDITDVPRLDSGTSGDYDTSTSDRFLISSDALMFKSISLGYTLPERWTNKANLSNVRVSLAAENLFLLSKRKGMNPMMNYSGVTGTAFYDYSKTIVGSLSFSF